jgi:hypothetical protein
MTTLFDADRFHFAVSNHAHVFFPWVIIGPLGALWAFTIPTDECRNSLSRFLRRYHLGSFGSFVMIYAIGICSGFGKDRNLLEVSIVLSMAVYATLIQPRIRNLSRLSLREGLRLFAAQQEDETLWRFVVLAVMVLLAAWGFQVDPLVDLAFTAYFAFFAMNGLMALYLFRLKHSE